MVQKTKRLSHRKLRKKYSKTIEIDKFSDGMYAYFLRMKLNPTHNFINFTTLQKENKIKFKFESRVNHKYNQNLTWDDINCEEKDLGENMIIKTNCKKNTLSLSKYNVSRYKIFVKGYMNLYQYIQAIKKGRISKSQHSLLFNAIMDQIKFLKKKDIQLNVINHNLDVNILHFKFIRS